MTNRETIIADYERLEALAKNGPDHLKITNEVAGNNRVSFASVREVIEAHTVSALGVG